MMPTTEPDLPPSERAKDLARILRALRQGVEDALRQHKRDGDPIAVWRDGRVVWLSAEEIPVSLDEPKSP